MGDGLTCDVCGKVVDKHATGEDFVLGLNAFWPPEPEDGTRDAAWVMEYWVHRRCLPFVNDQP